MSETICSHMSNRMMLSDKLSFSVGVVTAFGDAYYWPHEHLISKNERGAKPDYLVRVSPKKEKVK